MATLPPLTDVLASSPASPDSLLAAVLGTLFEESHILSHTIVPALAAHIAESHTPPSTYTGLVNEAVETTRSLPPHEQALFIGAHPRIGEVSNLSAFSAVEQALRATSPWVLARLSHLNACYERRYPGLVYVTFVNGRSREDVMHELEGVLGVDKATSETSANDLILPPVESFIPVETQGPQWRQELDRAVVDVGQIAKARIRGMGLD
jgi:2-oxo-4-hydroxy-4-carboxy--5-ureidoimidazoline (OHCU) decarboxylase